MSADPLVYLAGFDGPHQSEAIAGALPRRQNSPRKAPLGLFPEQVNGTPFTTPRAENRRSWLYRIRPLVTHSALEPFVSKSQRFGVDYLAEAPNPNLVGWTARPMAAEGVDFVDGLATVAGAGDPANAPGLAVHRFEASSDMDRRAFANHDGDLMILPDTGELSLRTELGCLRVAPGELVVVPRGLAFEVGLIGGPARGVVFEIYGRHFELPGRGPIGANGLADERHFQAPTASYVDGAGEHELIVKLGGALFRGTTPDSPFDVVAWHGNYFPYRYDMGLFNAMGTVSWDHPDPSIYTVLSASLHHPGSNLADLVIFPNDRWDVAQHTFRPPYYHRNAVTEINALVDGPERDGDVFSCGGLYITPPFSAHGPGTAAADGALALDDADADKPHLIKSETLWIQIETVLTTRVAAWAWSERVADMRAFAAGVSPRFAPPK